jgi:hypothetical protein
MKKFFIIAILLLSVIGCKKKGYSPEGPTDVRIRNISDVNFEQVIISTSEKAEDIDTIDNIAKVSVSDYSRFSKAYPKANISAKINVNGRLMKFTTVPVDYTYMQYIGRDRITYEVYISNMNKMELAISNVIFEEPLVLK